MNSLFPLKVGRGLHEQHDSLSSKFELNVIERLGKHQTFVEQLQQDESNRSRLAKKHDKEKLSMLKKTLESRLKLEQTIHDHYEKKVREKQLEKVAIKLEHYVEASKNKLKDKLDLGS